VWVAHCFFDVKKTRAPYTYLVWKGHSLPDDCDDAVVRIVDSQQIWATDYVNEIAFALLRHGHTVRLESQIRIKRKDLLYRASLEPVA